MKENERQQLAAWLAQMDTNERKRLMKRASQLRKISRFAAKQPSRRSYEIEEDEHPTPAKRSSPPLEEYVWRIFMEEEAATKVEAQADLVGMVVSMTSGACEVSMDCQVVKCFLSPDLAARQQTDLAVGDNAALQRRGDDFVVVGVLPRRTKLSRPDVGNSHRERVVVANVDAVVVVVSVVSPPLHPRLIDRYLIAIQRGGALPVIAVNKLDLHETEEALQADLERLSAYRALGVPVVACSASTGRGREELLQALCGKLSAFVGHSGVGKSSLLNMVSPDLELKTGDVSEGYGRGTHTTTRSVLCDLGNGTRVIDTPGIRSFGLWKLRAEELPWYFPEFALVGRCKFSDCTHTHEPACRVKLAVKEGSIAEDRYDTYLRIRETLRE